jgi:glycosyltransferase involved in cell wall biosynthesis
MRVVMVILEYAPITGGAQRQIAALAPPMMRRGVEIHVLTRRRAGLAAEEMLDGVRVHRLPAPGPKAIASLVFTAAALFRLMKLRPDVVHAYSLFSPTTIAVLARRLFGVPVIVKVLRGGQGGDVARLRQKTLSTRRIAALRGGVDRFVSISREIGDELAGLDIDPARTVAIPNGVDVSRFRPADGAERDALRDRLALPAGPVLIYVGRLVAEKRVDRLITAFCAVRDAHPDATLVIAGAGADEPALRAQAGAGVRFLGDVDDVAPWLRAADLFVLPSEAEGLSNALLEAMATGLAVVATRVGGAADVVEDGRSGRLVAVDDAAALVAALLDLVGSDAAGTRAAFGRAARAKVTLDHALDAVALRLTDLYREIHRVRPLDGPVPVPGRHSGEGTRP